jgi:hypothetical protein
MKNYLKLGFITLVTIPMRPCALCFMLIVRTKLTWPCSINGHDTYSSNSRNNRVERRTAAFGWGIGAFGRATLAVFLALAILEPGKRCARGLLLLDGRSLK